MDAMMAQVVADDTTMEDGEQVVSEGTRRMPPVAGGMAMASVYGGMGGVSDWAWLDDAISDGEEPVHGGVWDAGDGDGATVSSGLKRPHGRDRGGVRGCPGAGGTGKRHQTASGVESPKGDG